MTTAEKIAPIIRDTYGVSAMSAGLIVYLAEQIDAWPNTRPGYGGRTREDMILHTCWNWFSGGSTAEVVAREIEEALNV